MKMDMKRIIENRWRVLLTITVLLAASCETDVVKPILSADSEFTGPTLTNTATSSATVLDALNAGDTYETFQWTKTDYDGMALGTTYTLEIDDSTNFNNSRNLATTINTTSAITVEQFNNAMLALGVPGFEKDTVYLRVRSVIDRKSTR